MCRVEAVARPRPNAAIGMSLWLPPADRWSGRYYQMGNGGFAGSIDRATLAAAAARGDAAAATDTGHRGTGFDAGWARGRPDLVEDYAARSIKLTADTARALIARHYGRPPTRRYFMGCSFGGRQGLIAAARWPADWDGVIAGAPAIEWVDWMVGFARIQHRLRAAPDAWLPPDRIAGWAAIARAGSGPAVAALRRGCRSGRADACIGPAQAAALGTIERAGYRLADADPAEWRRWILNADPAAPSQARFASEAYANLFAPGSAWSADRPPPRAEAAIAALRRRFAAGRLDPFLRRGGRLFVYVGSADAVLPPAGILSALDARLPAGSLRQAGVRRMTVPGMAHCQGGDVPHAFGQALIAPGLRDAPGYDLRRTMEAWVETGRAPTGMVARAIDTEQTVILPVQ